MVVQSNWLIASQQPKHTVASVGNAAVVKMLTDPSFQMLEALHPSSKETQLDADARNCHVDVVIEAPVNCMFKK